MVFISLSIYIKHKLIFTIYLSLKKPLTYTWMKNEQGIMMVNVETFFIDHIFINLTQLGTRNAVRIPNITHRKRNIPAGIRQHKSNRKTKHQRCAYKYGLRVWSEISPKEFSYMSNWIYSANKFKYMFYMLFKWIGSFYYVALQNSHPLFVFHTWYGEFHSHIHVHIMMWFSFQTIINFIFIVYDCFDRCGRNWELKMSIYLLLIANFSLIHCHKLNFIIYHIINVYSTGYFRL